MADIACQQLERLVRLVIVDIRAHLQITPLELQTLRQFLAIAELQCFYRLGRFAIKHPQQGQPTTDTAAFKARQTEANLMLKQSARLRQKIHLCQPVRQFADHLVTVIAGRGQFTEFFV